MKNNQKNSKEANEIDNTCENNEKNKSKNEVYYLKNIRISKVEQLMVEGLINKSLSNQLRPNNKLFNEEIKDNDKKIKSEGDKKNAYEVKFILKKISNCGEIYNHWNKNIKSMIINEENQILKKLPKNELILKYCQENAIKKIQCLKGNDINEILNILSYDNTNPDILYICFKKIKNIENLDKWLEEYKYCLSNEMNIKDYKNNNITHIYLNKEFNYQFVFQNETEARDKLKDAISNLKELALAFFPNNNFIYEYDYNNNWVLDKEKINKDGNENDRLYNLGYKFVQNYIYIKDFSKFKQNQPFSYENNSVLFYSFLLNEIYKPLLKIEEKKIMLRFEYLQPIKNLNSLLTSIINDLSNNIINKEFIYKIRFFNIIFESSDLFYCENLNADFMGHLLRNKLTESEIYDFIKVKQTIDQLYGNEMKYSFDKKKLIIEKLGSKIQYDMKDYDNSLIYSLYDNNQTIRALWEKNSFDSFQRYNFLMKDDIELIKQTTKKIFKSKFWNEILTRYCETDITKIGFFQSDEFIEQYFEKVIFLPFDANKIGFYAFTASDDLYVFISGYPFEKSNCFNFNDYLLYRILQSGLMVIIILHENLHFIKRLLYFLTCGIVERLTMKNEERDEAGNIFEEKLFGWKEKKDKKLNIEIALKLLDSNIYDKGFDDTKKNLESKERVKYEKNEILKNYLEKLGLKDLSVFENYIQSTKHIYLNASRELNQDFYVIHYMGQDHRKLNI